MRIADKMNYEQVKTSLTKNRAELADLQNKASLQKRVTKPSDDPVAATRVLAARTEIQGGAQFLKTINQAKSFLEYSEQSLGELAEALVRAKELAISQANDASANENSRAVTATEVDQILSQSIQIGNRKLGDRFLFGGYRTMQAPFDGNGAYQGDDGEMTVQINKEASVAMNLPGNRVFLGKAATPAAAQGAQGDAAPKDADAGGAQAPASVPAERSSQRPAAPMLRGPASVAHGQGQAEASGADSPGIRWSTNGINIFKTLRDLETALRTNDKESVQDSLDVLDEAIAQVIMARSQLGARVATLNSTMESLQKGQVETKTMASNLEDADTFELVSDINKTESTLKATLATSGKLVQPSLLDFLR